MDKVELVPNNEFIRFDNVLVNLSKVRMIHYHKGTLGMKLPVVSCGWNKALYLLVRGKKLPWRIQTQHHHFSSVGAEEFITKLIDRGRIARGRLLQFNSTYSKSALTIKMSSGSHYYMSGNGDDLKDAYEKLTEALNISYTHIFPKEE